MTHVYDLVKRIRALSDAGADMYAVHLPSYRHGEFTVNQDMMTNQLELLGEHVIPKVARG
ncbi:MAG: hypothetical protein EXR53_05600 [Dehalococcoidia bacterium]|nr:hypothetical protein [Dehalococcoidia bacterium]